MVGTIQKPSILVDMRKCRIRIHRNTLHALGDPEFVMLIVNPEEHTLGVQCSTIDDKSAHRVHKSNVKKKDCYELYSKSLIAALHRLCPEWNDKGSYKIEGTIIADEDMAVFSMKDFSVLGS